MSRWVPVRANLTVGDEEPRVVYTATAIDGSEPAFHPMFYTPEECIELCRAMNELGWDEEDYFKHSKEVAQAIANGTVSALVVKRTVRGFFRGILRGFGWGRS